MRRIEEQRHKVGGSRVCGDVRVGRVEAKNSYRIVVVQVVSPVFKHECVVALVSEGFRQGGRGDWKQRSYQIDSREC